MKTNRVITFRRHVWLAVFVAASLSAADADVSAFIQHHCVECHGPDVQKAKLRLDTLKPDFAERNSADVWTRMLDKVSAGQMPPASEERPKPEDIKTVTQYLGQKLHDASLSKQNQLGRVLMRRMNRTEYENSLRDLLGDVGAPANTIDVSGLLPEDSSAAGFDNVGAALNLSSAHFLRYQEAAEKALATVMPVRPAKYYKEHRTAADIVKTVPGFKDFLGKWLLMREDSMLMFARAPAWTSIVRGPTDLQPGTYRYRVSASAVNSNGKPLPLAFLRISEVHYNDGVAEACYDVQPDKPTLITHDFIVRPKERLQVFGWLQPIENDFVAKTKKENIVLENCKEPAIAVQWVEIEGPIDAAPRGGYRNLFGDLPTKPVSVVAAENEHKPLPKINEKRKDEEWRLDPLIPVSADPKADSEKLLRGFLPLAFRRPVDDATIQHYKKFALERMETGYAFGDAMLATYRSALCSTYFLLLDEKPGALDGYALASRLSYFVWRSMPDAELMALAANGKLLQADVLHAQLERMLNDNKAQRFISDFVGQWLDMRKIDATVPDLGMYPEHDNYLLWSMPLETEAFFTEVLKKDLPVTQFIDSDWTFVNERLAFHYGFKDVAGSQMRRVTLPPDSHRGGVLTQASILKVTADGTRTSPVLRGKWVLDKIVGKPPSPPPPDVPSIDPDIRGATTIRQQLDKHRNTAACASCHKYIDPPGFALESFDVIGGWREFYRTMKSNGKNPKLSVPGGHNTGYNVFRGLDVEKGDKTPDGRVFKDIDDYKKILLEDKDQLIRNVVQKLMVFSTGGEIQFADREVVEQIIAKERASGGGLRSIIHDIVGSRMFLNK
jgi:hypothetical protein